MRDLEDLPARLSDWTPANRRLQGLPEASRRLVYRCETPAGLGMYDAGGMSAFGSECPDNAYLQLHHPGPDRDGVPMWRVDSSFYFGFTSKAQLTAWLDCAPGRVAMAERREVFPAVYEIQETDVLPGSSQVVFKRTRARRIEWLRPNTLGHLCAGNRNPAKAWGLLVGRPCWAVEKQLEPRPGTVESVEERTDGLVDLRLKQFVIGN